MPRCVYGPCGHLREQSVNGLLRPPSDESQGLRGRGLQFRPALHRLGIERPRGQEACDARGLRLRRGRLGPAAHRLD